ncbi:MAG TPA: tetratricopeptide repeat protein [Methylotenera sp.]|nr:tetratricopeptide repeat protein [Methylotenera sp.]
MKTIKAFVGHSFNAIDGNVVGTILNYLDVVSEANKGFVWEHAEHAEPKVLADKVISMLGDKNVFIGICTKKELVISPDSLKDTFWNTKKFKADKTSFVWKTSDWVIQEIGLAIGRNLTVILLIEDGVRAPGGLQGNLEVLYFNRDSPEKCFPKLLEMINTLSPKQASKVADHNTVAIPVVEEESEDLTNDKDGTPKDSWDFKDYKYAYFHCIGLDNTKKAGEINTHFLASHVANQIPIEEWEAHKEFVKLMFDRDGNFSNLLKLSEENPTNHKILENIANVYEKFGESEKAALYYEQSASLVPETRQKLLALFNSLKFLLKVGKREKALLVFNQMKTLYKSGTEETLVLTASQNIAKELQYDDIMIAAMERQLDIDPSDSEIRFSLAYKYSEIGCDDLAAMHYSKIPFFERHGAAWNNLGNSFNILKLPAKAVEAFRESEKKGESYAIANLANQFIDSGFLIEAKTILDSAKSLAEHTNNVERALIRLNEVTEAENKSEAEIFTEAQAVSDFYKELGKSSLLTLNPPLESYWQGPDCILKMVVNNLNITLSGTYERTGLGAVALAILGTYPTAGPRPSIKYVIEYEGFFHGKSIVGKVARQKVDEPKKTSSLLDDDRDAVKVLMVMDDANGKINVLEIAKNVKPKKYELKMI